MFVYTKIAVPETRYDGDHFRLTVTSRDFRQTGTVTNSIRNTRNSDRMRKFSKTKTYLRSTNKHP